MHNVKSDISVHALRILAVLTVFIFCVLTIESGIAQSTNEVEISQKLKALPWIIGPNEGQISGKARIKFGADYKFLGASGTKQFLELNGNLPAENHFTLAKNDYSWFAVFSFDESGYVKDDEKIDAEELLVQLKRGNEVANKERKERGLHILHLEGWFVSPRYDTDTKRLEWGTRLRTEDQQAIVNFTSRLLGRTGVMSAVLVSDPDNLQRDVVEFKTALRNFEYNPGEKYTEFRQGDKVAEYGLAALIVGGAAAAAAKSGAGKAFFKLIGVAIIGGIAAIAAFLKRIMGKK